MRILRKVEQKNINEFIELLFKFRKAYESINSVIGYIYSQDLKENLLKFKDILNYNNILETDKRNYENPLELKKQIKDLEKYVREMITYLKYNNPFEVKDEKIINTIKNEVYNLCADLRIINTDESVHDFLLNIDDLNWIKSIGKLIVEIGKNYINFKDSNSFQITIKAVTYWLETGKWKE